MHQFGDIADVDEIKQTSSTSGTAQTNPTKANTTSNLMLAPNRSFQHQLQFTGENTS